MSAIASFVLVPKSALAELRAAATPLKGWFGKPKDAYPAVLRGAGKEASRYGWSGYVLATLLPYLAERHVDLMESEYGELADYLTKVRGSTHFIFTEKHKQSHLYSLSPDSYSERELRDYYNRFNETNEPEAGKPMLDGIRALQQSLASVDQDSVVVFSIGQGRDA